MFTFNSGGALYLASFYSTETGETFYPDTLYFVGDMGKNHPRGLVRFDMKGPNSTPQWYFRSLDGAWINERYPEFWLDRKVCWAVEARRYLKDDKRDIYAPV